MTTSVAAVDRPLLLAGGTADTTAPAGYLRQLAGLAKATRKVTVHSYRAGHDLSGVRAELITDTVQWLNDTGLAATPRIVTTTVDTVAKDGTPLAGILYSPTFEPAPSRPAFMIVHGWTGDVPRSTSHALALRIAQHGYTVLAVRTRASGFRGTVSARLEDIPQDLAAWTNFLGARGIKHVIGIGHATGGLWLSTYLAQSHDRRFRGVVYLGPPRDLPEYARRAMGDEAYDHAVAEAEAAVTAGQGKSHLIDVPFPQASYDEDPRQPMFLAAPTSGYTDTRTIMLMLS
jgi:pimeloyl-ACP methyl ester carboxylesterase